MRLTKIILILLVAFECNAQINNPVIAYNPDSVKLSGRYDFGGVNSDMGKFYYYNQNISGNYRMYARVHNNIGASPAGKVIVMFNDVSPTQKTGGLPIHYVSASQGEIALYSRPSKGLRTQKIASVPVAGYPSWIYIEKDGTNVVGKYSLQPLSTTIENVNWNTLGTISNAFAGWTNIKKGIGVASGSASYSSATVSKFTIQAPEVLSPPTISSNPLTVVNGLSATFTAIGCTTQTKWYANSTQISTINPLVVSNPTTGTIYTARCSSGTNTSVSSNQIVVQAPSTEGQLATMTNVLKSVPYETVLEKYSPHLFPTISAPVSYDATVGTNMYNWQTIWQVDGTEFKNNNRTVQSVGLAMNPDVNPIFYNGIGTRCQEFIYTFNPDNGCPWGQERVSGNCTGTITNIDPSCGQTYNTFITSIPLQNRAYNLAGVNPNAWDGYTLEQVYNEGVGASSSIMLGGGDKVNGLYNTAVAWSDIEEGSEVGSQNLTAYMWAMRSTSRGYVVSMYSQIFNTLGYISPSAYPDVNGEYTLNPDINVSWLSTYRVSVPSKNMNNKSMTDDKRIGVGGEISHYASSTFYHGTKYSKTGVSGDSTVVDKFGTDANVEHPIARIITNLEQQRWYIDNKMDGRKAYYMTKITCDRNNFGLNPDIGETNTALQFKHLDRRQSFMTGMFTFLLKHEWLIWDRNIDNRNADGYNGVFGFLNLANQKKTLTSVSKSATDLYPDLIADNWDTEISYNGTTWTKHKGMDYQLNPNIVECRTAYTNSGYWVLGCARPEKVEPTEVWVRKTIAGVTQVVHIAPSMWETCNPAYSGTPLSGIPTSDKDFYFNIFKVGSAN